ncbi:MAG: hypothetical protein M3Q27_05835 [Actinomycetota bacterium]|nr:hypothetical protein [Actinomycetota bacterium]
MGLLDSLVGGGGGGGDFNDFLNRYDQGAPYDGIGDDEALERYRQVDSEIDDDTYHSAARESFSRMQPDERRGFAEQLVGMTGQQGLEVGFGGATDDPDTLAAMTTQARRQQPDLLGSLLGAGMGGGMGGLGGGMGGLGGLAGAMGGGGGGNPIAKAAIAGIAAMAARRMMQR